MVSNQNTKENLPRTIKLWDAVAIIIGSIIGAGIFRTPGSIARILPFPGLIILAWIAGGLLCLIGALCFGELSGSFPASGGEYVYLREAFGRSFAFVFGWTKALVIRAGAIAGIAYVFAGYLGYFFPCSLLTQKILASGVILLLTVINLLGVRYGKGMQNVLTMTKVLALLAIILFGLLIGKGSSANFSPFLPRTTFVMRGLPDGFTTGSLINAFGMALIFVLWTYGGWNESVYVGGEIKDPGRNLPRSLFLGTAMVMVIYLLTNLLWLWYVPLQKMAATDVVASVMMERLLGKAGGRVISAVILVSTLGALNALVFTGGRISYAIARDNPVFKRISKVHPTFKTPALALAVNAFWAMVLIFSGTFDQIVSFTSVAFWFFLGMTGVSLFVLRKRFPDIHRPYKVWGYPFTPLVFIAATLFLVINTTWCQPKEAIIGFVIILSGIPVYLLSRIYVNQER